MSGVPYIGSKISLISKSEVRYEGILHSIDTVESTVSLENVRSFGTEGRAPGKEMPKSDQIYDLIIFRGSDIKDLHVCEAPAQPPQQPKPAVAIPPMASQPDSVAAMPGARPPGFPSFAPHPMMNPYGMNPYFMNPMYQQQYWQQMQQQQQQQQQQGSAIPPPVAGMFPPMPMMMPHDPSFLKEKPLEPTPTKTTVEAPRPKSVQKPPPSQQTPVKIPPQPASVAKPPVQHVPARENDPEPARVDNSETRKHESGKGYNSQPRGGHNGRGGRSGSYDNKNIFHHEQNGRPRNQDNDQQERSGYGQNNEERQYQSLGRGRGRGRGHYNSYTAKGIVIPETEFDFEGANARFKKEEKTEEIEVTEPKAVYDKTRSFFDDISCETKERMDHATSSGIDRKAKQLEDRRLNLETFGKMSIDRRGRGRGRGRGFYRGGYRRNFNNNYSGNQTAEEK